MNIIKLIKIHTIFLFIVSYFSILQAQEIQIILPISASGGNNNKLSINETTNKFSTIGYGLGYIFKSNIGLGYTSSIATYEGNDVRISIAGDITESSSVPKKDYGIYRALGVL